MVLYKIRCPDTGCWCATELITFKAEKLGTRYAAPVASQRVSPWVKPANPRKSSAKLPITNRENANTAESSGDENDENNNASAVIITNCRMMKYNANSIQESGILK